jgi:hypothetical protein
VLGRRERTLESISMRRLFASSTILAIFLTSFALSPANAVDPCALDISGNVLNGFSPRGPSTCTEIVIPDSVTSIAPGAFYGHVAALETLIIGSGIKIISSSAFYGAQSLRSLTIPNTVITIEFDAFTGASALEILTIGNSVTTIGSDAFAGATSLRSLTIPNSVITIENNAFRYSGGLRTLIIGNSVTAIGDNAFEDAYLLTSLTIPNSVTTIGDEAFLYVELLESLTIGNGVTSIGEDAFKGASALNTVTFLGQAPGYVDRDAFSNVKVGAKAIVTSANVASFSDAGRYWKGLLVEIAASDAPPTDDGAVEAARVAAIALAASEAARVAAIAEAARVAAIAEASRQATAAAAAKQQRELTEILSIIPSLGSLALNLGETTKALTLQKCVKKTQVKYVKKGAKCPKGFVRKR